MDDELRTLAALPFHFVGRHPKPALLRRCRGDAVEELSTQEFFDRIRDFSLGLGALGVEPGDRVAILSDSRPEWLIADLAALTAGAVTAPIYPTLPEGQVRYILADSGARVVVVADETQAAKVRAVWDELPDLSALVLMDPAGEPKAAAGAASGREELSLAEATGRGHRRLMTEDGLGREYKERAAAVAPDQLATIIYTSGTTGEPKGVMLTHGNVASNVMDGGAVVRVHAEDDALSFLPLSHAFERAVVFLYLYHGVTVTFAESLDTIARDLGTVKPTVMTGVPRVYEKFHARVHEAVAGAPAVRRRLFHWAVGVGLRQARARLAGRSVGLSARLQLGLAERLVLSKIRGRLGGRLRFVVSGSAPLSTPIAEFFFAIGIPVVEGYGLTETSPTLTVNPLERPKLGTVGPAIRNVELRIADDGEVLARGPNVMQGYYGKPEATAEVMRDGWFCTGDIGSLDDDGYLTILDRKKELIVTAGGKNIAPNPIEAELKRSPLVAEAVLIGDRRPYVSALLVPDFAALAAHTGAGAAVASREEIVERPDVVALFDEVVGRVNTGLARHEQIKRSALLPAEFGIATGELTPTLKVKRRVVAQRWSDVIERLYAS
jgi:long-chain acyl-CoA synthetase